jgi:hypothetical protein
MRFAIAFLAAAGLLAAAAPSFAKGMSDGRYMRAQRCVAYSKLPQLEGVVDTALLEGVLKKESHSRMPPIPEQVRKDADEIRMAGTRAKDEEAVGRLKTKQAETCEGLVSPGPVSNAEGAKLGQPG